MFRHFAGLFACVPLMLPAHVASAAASIPRSDALVIQPMPLDGVTVRYVRGAATLSRQQQRGMVQLRPMRFDRGRISFSVAVFNDGPAPVNFDRGNVSVRVDGRFIAILSYDTLVKQAERRAGLSQFGVAVVGILAAGATASQRDTYSATYRTPYGTYRSTVSVPKPTAGIETIEVLRATTFTASDIQNRLDRTIDALSDEIVQRTTVDPGDSYGGRVVVEKATFKPGASELRVNVRWYGEDYAFLLRVVKTGTPEPDLPITPPPEDVRQEESAN